MRVLRTALPLLLGALFAVAGLGCGESEEEVAIYFVHGVMIDSVQRTVPADYSAETALYALLAGPDEEEVADGFFTEIPEGTQLISYELSEDGRTAQVDLSSAFADRTEQDEFSNAWGLRGGIAQVVFTVMETEEVDEVDILVEGETIVTESVEGLTTPSEEKHQEAIHPSEEASHQQTAPEVDVAAVEDVQAELIRLRYLPGDGATGEYDYQTKMAIMAFQGWEGIDKDGVVGPQTTEALKGAEVPRPEAVDIATGKVAQVFRDKGVVLLLQDGELVRAVHTSTGKPGKETPAGTYEVYQKEESHWSHAYNVELPWASFFHGGYAFHEYPEVPPYPASHGCARLPSPEAPRVYDFVEIGTPVYVY